MRCRNVPNRRRDGGSPFRNDSAVPSSDARLVHSDDAVIDLSDPLLGDLSRMTPLTGGLSEDLMTIQVRLPFTTPAGNYQIGLLVEGAAAVMELDPGNNVRSVPLTVTALGPVCDFNLDGGINVSDVQTVIDAALGLAAGNGLEDVNRDGSTT